MTHLSLQKAIHNNEAVAFTYQNILTIVEPHRLGLSAEGDITLTAWQVSGGGRVGWRHYLIDKVRGAAPTGLYFRNPRTGYNANKTTMKHILAQIKPRAEPAASYAGW